MKIDINRLSTQLSIGYSLMYPHLRYIYKIKSNVLYIEMWDDSGLYKTSTFDLNRNTYREVLTNNGLSYQLSAIEYIFFIQRYLNIHIIKVTSKLRKV